MFHQTAAAVPSWSFKPLSLAFIARMINLPFSFRRQNNPIRKVIGFSSEVALLFDH